MSKPIPLLALFAAGVLVGGGIGMVVGARSADDRIAALQAELERARAGAVSAPDDTTESGPARSRSRVDPTVERLQQQVAELEVQVADAAALLAAQEAANPAASEDGNAEATSAERDARVAALNAQVPVWLERGDGEAAVAALRELAAMVPEGREAAMALALAINADVNGDGRLRLSDVAFYGGLGDAGVKALMDWALPRDDTPADFRVMAAYSLPWTQAPSRTLEQFAGALASEKDASVQRALVANLGRLRSPEAERLLADVLTNPDRDAALRAEAAGALAAATDPGVERALEIAAEKDADASVRDAARATLVGRNPPATGYLVTGTLPDSQASAAGMRAGDVLVRYGDTPVPTVDALRAAAEAASGQDLVPVTVVRDGQEVRLLVRPGRLGVYGRAVEAAGK